MNSTQVAIVTGGGDRRIGWYVAEAMANRGYALVLPYRSSDSRLVAAVDYFQSRNVEVLGLAVDIADELAVQDLIDQVLKTFGRLDALVNCAGVWEARRLEEVTAADVRKHFESNALGTFLCSQHAGLAMVNQATGGCIVTVGDWADTRPYTGYAAYFPSKGAIPAMTRSLAVELGSRNPAVRVNCLLPGPVLFRDDLSSEERSRSVSGTLVRRAGRPENIAQAVLSFLDNDFITGACLAVDGGRSIFAPDSV
jgi:pteridine reductase